jgi:hypothetical protein
LQIKHKTSKMSASNIFQDKINNAVTRFDVSRNGELVDNPIQLRIENKPFQAECTLFLNNKEVLYSTKATVLAEADRIESLTKEELKSEFGINV